MATKFGYRGIACHGLFAIAAALCVGVASATSTPEGWTDDFEAAKAQAEKEGKLLLVDFSGSDWCGWCMKLDSEVFAKPEFLKGVKKDFVLVMIDSPRDKTRLSEKAAKQNPELVRKYRISGYPTVLIMDAAGEVLDTTGYRNGGAKAYVKYLKDVRKSSRAIVDMKREIAALAEGDPARLAKIDAVFASFDKEMLRKNASYVNELLKHDPNGKYAAKYPFIKYCLPLEKKFEETLNELQGRFFKKMREAAKNGQKPSKETREAVMAEVNAEAVELLAKVQKEIAAAKASAPANAKKDIAELEKKIGTIAKQLGSKKK